MKKRINPFWSYLFALSSKTDLPLHLYILYFPGTLLFSFIVSSPLGTLGNIALSIFDLYGIKLLYDRDCNSFFDFFYHMIIINPYIFAFMQIGIWVKPDLLFDATAERFLGLRIAFVIAAYLCILMQNVTKRIGRDK